MTATIDIDELLAGHAAGRLPEPVAIVVATHLALSPRNRRRYNCFQAAGGLLLEEIDPAPISAQSFERVLAHLDDEEEVEQAPPLQSGSRRWPLPLAHYLRHDDRHRWSHYGSASELDLPTSSADFRVRMICVKAGRAVPRHTHSGFEVTVVLEGAYIDEFGRFGPGDIEIADGEVDHQPIAEPGKDCYCLAVTDAPLRLTGRFSRFLNPFIKV